ncbi:D-2-hydroxyacid dehydrogenase [Elioraea sp.]|jgi:phosphoglycerate dehydrogenase-like enzyme|uniref:D-2-hydroxyacid dehydrogenase n=1 Tax=Elioraea sp. TaxID=2185103 RepID=UPI0021DEE36C|nr:D-2-hydroxyacid dehydrogenase [Elioraea sp.]GIX09202.1 MAG: 3-phosphoglycerate dehydrogenase [Elioraea sp.]
MLPPKDRLTVCFAHVAYRFGERFPLRNTGIGFHEVRDREALEARIGEADVLVVSGMWRNDLAPKAKKLRFIQSISAGVDQYDRQVLAAHGIRLASAQGANANAVSEHGMALILAIARRIPEAVRNQDRRFWRGMIGDLGSREDELGGKTLLVVGIGRIGGRLARLAKAFDMRVIGVRRDPSAGAQGADEIHGFAALPSLWGRADIVALTCPLTPETTGLVDATALAAMKPGAQLVNLARGKVVDEPALIAAMRAGHLSAAALDVTAEEPLPADSPLWTLPNVLITPHTGGETRRYEDAVIDLLLENLDRLWRGETTLRNQVV